MQNLGGGLFAFGKFSEDVAFKLGGGKGKGRGKKLRQNV